MEETKKVKTKTAEEMAKEIAGAEEEKAKKANFIVRCFRAVKDSPVAAGIGAVGGAIVTGIGFCVAALIKSRSDDVDDAEEELCDCMTDDDVPYDEDEPTE